MLKCLLHLSIAAKVVYVGKLPKLQHERNFTVEVYIYRTLTPSGIAPCISIHGSRPIGERIRTNPEGDGSEWPPFPVPFIFLQQLNGVVKNGVAFHYNVLTSSGMAERLRAFTVFVWLTF